MPSPTESASLVHKAPQNKIHTKGKDDSPHSTRMNYQGFSQGNEGVCPHSHTHIFKRAAFWSLWIQTSQQRGHCPRQLQGKRVSLHILMWSSHLELSASTALLAGTLTSAGLAVQLNLSLKSHLFLCSPTSLGQFLADGPHMHS